MIAIPPGEIIKEQLEYYKMSNEEFAKRMNMSKEDINKLLEGNIKIAKQLEDLFNVPEYFWTNLELIYWNKLGQPNCI